MRGIIFSAWTLSLAAITGPALASCQIADIMFGKVAIKGSIVRSATFDNPQKPYNSILGEVGMDRDGGWSVRNLKQEVVGRIYPNLVLDGWDVVCDKRSKVIIRPVQPGVY